LQPKPLPYNQVPQFGEALRALLGGGTNERELAGIVVSEIEELARRKAAGGHHPKENDLGQGMEPIRSLELYRHGHSVRIYFSVIDGVIWFLGLDENKRRTAMTSGTKESLMERHEVARKLSGQLAARRGSK